MDIRRKVLFIMFVLSLGIIVSGCDNGGNNAESEGGGNSMSDVNDVVMNEENKQVEPRDMYWIDEELVNSIGFEKTFTVTPQNGKYLNIAVKSYSNAKVGLIVYRSGRMDSNKMINGNQGATLKYTITTSTTFRVVLETGGDGPFSVSIRARQFNAQTNK